MDNKFITLKGKLTPESEELINKLDKMGDQK
jgi:hypothetical protein